MTTVSVPESLTGPVTPDARCSCGSVDLRAVVADQAAELERLRGASRRLVVHAIQQVLLADDVHALEMEQAQAELIVLRRVVSRYRNAGVSIPAEVTR
jgi:hypothetical protein